MAHVAGSAASQHDLVAVVVVSVDWQRMRQEAKNSCEDGTAGSRSDPAGESNSDVSGQGDVEKEIRSLIRHDTELQRWLHPPTMSDCLPATFASALPGPTWTKSSMDNDHADGPAVKTQLVPAQQQHRCARRSPHGWWMFADGTAEMLYEVESIMARRESCRGTVEYRVKWLGYPDTEASWLTRRHLWDQGLRAMLRKFDAVGPVRRE